MSILIINEEFPQSCWGCPCCSVQHNGFAGWDHYCNLLDEFVSDYQYLRHKLCPLVEVPNVYNIETRSLTNEERKSYIEALKKGGVKTGNKLYFDDKGGE